MVSSRLRQHSASGRLRLTEGRNGGRELIEPRDEIRVFRAPFSVMAEVEIAEPCRKGHMTVVGTGAPRWRIGFEIIEPTVDLRLLAIRPALHPLVLRTEPLLVDQQQSRIEQAVSE